MSSIFDSARLGATIMQQLRSGEDAGLRADLDRIARDMKNSWSLADIERIEDLPPYYLSMSLGGLGAYVKLVVRNTGGHVAIDASDWPYRLINYIWEKEIK